jgi:hypothetical protein
MENIFLHLNFSDETQRLLDSAVEDNLIKLENKVGTKGTKSGIEEKAYRDGIHQIDIRTLSVIRNYGEYLAKSVSKQGEEFLIAVLVKSYQESLSGI